MAKNTPENKQAIIDYYRTLPVYKYAANHVGIDQDTLKDWRDKDKEFSDRLDQARSDFYKLKVSKCKPEFLLERLDRENFGANLDITTKGKELPQPILGGISAVSEDQSDRQDTGTE